MDNKSFQLTKILEQSTTHVQILGMSKQMMRSTTKDAPDRLRIRNWRRRHGFVDFLLNKKQKEQETPFSHCIQKA